MVDPRALERVRPVGGEPLDRQDLAIRRSPDGRYARADRLTVDVDDARAAERLPAAVFRPCEAEHVAHDPQDGHLGIHVELARHSVHAQVDGHGELSS
jgi:hypothetical protein